MKVKKNNINIITLGCSKNLYDSEIFANQINKNKFDILFEDKIKENQTVIINTCGFIESAKQESIDTIFKYSNLKREGKINKLYVVGCLSQRYLNELKSEFNYVDKILGTKFLYPLLKELKNEYKNDLLGEQLISTPKHYAYLKISEGCNRSCSFCAIPLIRGKHVSRKIEDILNSAKLLVKNGVKEIILIAQDLTFYGLDIYKKRKLDYLLLKLCEINGLEWIRLHYAYPTGLTNSLIKTINNEKKICNYIDIPLQHSEQDIIKSMRRGYNSDKVNTLLNKLRSEIENIHIRTTLIVGYPGETLKSFENMCKWVQKNKFERLGIFKYSHEENTHAFKLEDNISEREKEKRLIKLQNIQKNISLQHNLNKINKKYDVIIDHKTSEYFVGRTQYDSPEVDNEVIIKNNNKEKVKIGKIYKVLINNASEYDIIGFFE